MRKRLMFGGLALAIIVAGVIALAAFTAQIVNLTAHVEKDIAVEPVICQAPENLSVPCFVDPRGTGIERKITLQNDSPIPMRVFVFAWGDIRDLISIDDAFFKLDAGDEHTILFELRAPASAEAKKYDGRVFVVQTPWPFPW